MNTTAEGLRVYRLSWRKYAFKSSMGFKSPIVSSTFFFLHSVSAHRRHWAWKDGPWSQVADDSAHITEFGSNIIADPMLSSTRIGPKILSQRSQDSNLNIWHSRRAYPCSGKGFIVEIPCSARFTQTTSLLQRDNPVPLPLSLLVARESLHLTDRRKPPRLVPFFFLRKIWSLPHFGNGSPTSGNCLSKKAKIPQVWAPEVLRWTSCSVIRARSWSPTGSQHLLLLVSGFSWSSWGFPRPQHRVNIAA